MRSTIVVGYNRTLPSGRALLEAGREAAVRGAEVTVVHAFDPSPREHPGSPTETAVRKAAAETAMFGVGVLHHRYPGLAVRAEAVPGPPHEVLAAAARQAALLVLGVGGEADGTAERHLGPVHELTLAATPCPTMVVRGPEHSPRGTVLAAINVSEHADEVVNFAFAEARFRSAVLHAVSAVETTELRTLVGAAGPPLETTPTPGLAGVQAALDQVLAERQARCAQLTVHGQAVDGPPSAILPAAAVHADVVVTGANRRDGQRHGVQLGPVTRALLQHTACPVIVVPHR